MVAVSILTGNDIDRWEARTPSRRKMAITLVVSVVAHAFAATLVPMLGRASKEDERTPITLRMVVTDPAPVPTAPVPVVTPERSHAHPHVEPQPRPRPVSPPPREATRSIRPDVPVITAPAAADTPPAPPPTTHAPDPVVQSAPVPTPAASAPVAAAPAPPPSVERPVEVAMARPSAGAGTEPAHSLVTYRKRPKPDYPMQARRLGLQGTVLVRVLVGADGRPQQVALERSSGIPLLDEAALAAVRDSAEFEPARRGDELVAHSVQVPIEFKLRP